MKLSCCTAEVTVEVSLIIFYDSAKYSHDCAWIGGPRPDMLERLVRFKDLDGMPKIDMSTPFEYFKKVKATADDIPTWVGELVRKNFRSWTRLY